MRIPALIDEESQKIGVSQNKIDIDIDTICAKSLKKTETEATSHERPIIRHKSAKE